MQFILFGLDGHSNEPKLERPLGFLRTTIIQHEANKIHVHKYKLILCQDKANMPENFNKINIHAVAHLLAFERTFLQFLAFMYFAHQGTPKGHFPVTSRELYQLKQQTGSFGLRHYSETLTRAFHWTLGTNNWFKDQFTLINVHNFLAALSKRNFGEFRPADSKHKDFVSPILLRANGDFELEQLNAYKNLIARSAGPILKDTPSLASFYTAYNVDILNKQIVVNIDVIASTRFTGISSFVNNYYGPRNLDVYKLFDKEMIKAMGCPVHAQDSQPDSQLAYGDNFSNSEFHVFTPPSGPIPGLDHTLVDETFTDPKPKLQRLASQQSIKQKLNWDDVFGKTGKTVKTSQNKQIAFNSGLTNQPTQPNNKQSTSTSTNQIKNIIGTDLLQGNNSDDYFSDDWEMDGSTIIVGRNKNESGAIFPIPSKLSNDSVSESQGTSPHSSVPFEIESFFRIGYKH